MGRYFGHQPRYSREEAEAQAKQAIDAAVSKGRPPDEDWKPLASRMADINRELATRPPVEIPPPPAPRREPETGSTARRRPVNEILRPRPQAEEPAPAAPPPKRRAPATKPPAPGSATRATPKKRPG